MKSFRMVLWVVDGRLEAVEKGGDVSTVYERLSHFGAMLGVCLFVKNVVYASLCTRDQRPLNLSILPSS